MKLVEINHRHLQPCDGFSQLALINTKNTIFHLKFSFVVIFNKLGKIFFFKFVHELRGVNHLSKISRKALCRFLL